MLETMASGVEAASTTHPLQSTRVDDVVARAAVARSALRACRQRRARPLSSDPCKSRRRPRRRPRRAGGRVDRTSGCGWSRSPRWKSPRSYTWNSSMEPRNNEAAVDRGFSLDENDSDFHGSLLGKDGPLHRRIRRQRADLELRPLRLRLERVLCAEVPRGWDGDGILLGPRLLRTFFPPSSNADSEQSHATFMQVTL